MPQFMLVLFQDPKLTSSRGPEEVQRLIEEYAAWANGLAQAGKLASGHKLKEEGGRSIRRDGRGLSVVDGPFAESKEVLVGYFVLNARDYAEAVELARASPHARYGTRIDVREFDTRCGLDV